MILREGTFLHNRYEIITRIGSGGMSDVYKALDTKLNRQVAIKVMKDEFCTDASFIEKFKVEAQSAAGLTHPNVVNVYDVIDEDGLHYIVMELVEGVTLKDFIYTKGMLSVRESLGIAVQVAQGIGAAHDQHIIHRDVKPQNVIIGSDGTVKVADFGIARAVSSETLSQAAMGSVHYISPEQAKGDPSDERSDIYSLGITLYEMLTGQTPFNGDNSVAIALAQIEQDMPLAGAQNPSVTPDVERIILKCCQKRPERRYQCTADLIADLRQSLAMLSVPQAAVPLEPDSQQTRVLTQEEVGEINARAKANAARKEREEREMRHPEPRQQLIKPKKPDKDSGIDKLIAIAGIVLAVVIVAVAVVFIGRATGLFLQNEEAETTEMIETESDLPDTQTYCPDVSSLSYELAEKKLTDSFLQIKVTYQDSDTVEKNMVINQNPQAGEIVDKYSTVEVIISNGSNSEDLTPLGLIGMMYEDARGLLLEKGYNVKMQEVFNEEYEASRVVRVNPINPERNGEVILQVSKGPEVQMTRVPSIVGQPEDVAVSLLADSNLVAGEITQVPSDTVEVGYIVSQTILPDTEISAGAAVGYSVSSGPQLQQVKYYSSLEATYDLNNLIGPGMNAETVNISIRLHQLVGDQDVYSTLMEPTPISGNTKLPIKYDFIEGVVGVDTGVVEVINADDGTVLKSYPVQFFAQQQ